MFIQPVNADAIIQSQRTRAGLEFDATREAVLDRYQGDRAFKKRMDDMCKRVAITPGSVHTNKFLTNFSVAYRNDAYIGERLLGLVMVANRSDKYLIWDKRNLMNAPDDLLVARARANEVFFNYTEDNYSLKDYGFKRHVDNETLKNSDDIFRDVLNNVEFLAELESLKRELRIAAVVGVAASYSGNSLSLAGSEWNATSSGGIYTGGAPVNAIRTALAARWQGFGRVKKIGFTSLDVFNVLSNHAQIRGLFGLNDSGFATQQQIARYFGLDELLVAEARYDTANIGQVASYSRIWGNVFGVVAVAQTPTKESAAFGSLFRETGDPVITEWFSPDEGKSGGHWNRYAVSEDIKVTAPDSSYLLTDVIS